MKYIIAFLFFLCSLSLSAKTYYTSPSGKDGNAGTLSAPFFSLNKAWAVVVSGDTVIMRGGPYSLNVQMYLKGKNKITVLNYPGEKPVIKKGSPYINDYYRGGCYFEGNDCKFSGIRITGFTQTDSYVWNGLLVMNSNNNVFELLEVDNNGAGMYIQGSSTGNLILNCDFHHNYDPITKGGNADGIDIAYVSAGTTNTIKGCRAWANSDDGFDFFENNGTMYADGNWSWGNGYIPGTTTPDANSNGAGFKLGSTSDQRTKVLRYLKNNLAFNNRLTGFHQEEALCIIEVTNNTSCYNNEHGYLLNYQGISHTAKNNIAYANGENNAVINGTNLNNAYGGSYGNGDNGWMNIVKQSSFVSVSWIGVDGPRKADGSLPDIQFMHPILNSNLKGIGCFSEGGIVPPPPPQTTYTYSTLNITASAGVNLTVKTYSDANVLIGTNKFKTAVGSNSFQVQVSTKPKYYTITQGNLTYTFLIN